MFIFNCIMRNVFHCEAKKVEEPAEEMETRSAETSLTPAELSLTPVELSQTPAEAFIHRQMQIADAKEQIATLCMNVISSPEDDVMIVLCLVK